MKAMAAANAAIVELAGPNLVASCFKVILAQHHMPAECRCQHRNRGSNAMPMRGSGSSRHASKALTAGNSSVERRLGGCGYLLRCRSTQKSGQMRRRFNEDATCSDS